MKTRTGLTMTVTGLILLVLTATVHFTVANSAQNITPTFSTSRFLMFGGNYQLASELTRGDSKQESGVFKIDTYTGKVWIMKAKVLQDGSRTEIWVPVKEIPPALQVAPGGNTAQPSQATSPTIPL